MEHRYHPVGYPLDMTIAHGDTARFADAIYAERIQRAAEAAAERGIDALLITPSVDYRYLVGYEPPPLERLTSLVLRPGQDPILVVPRLEEPLAVQELGDLAAAVDIQPWSEGSDPYQLIRGLLSGSRRVGIQDQMWARHALRFQAALDPMELIEAGNQPLNDLIAAMHTKALVAELERRRGAGDGSGGNGSD